MDNLAKILEQNLETKELDCDKELKRCPDCGDYIQKSIELLGKIRVVPKICKCEKEKLEKKKIEDVNKEKQIRLTQLIRNSLMDKDFAEKTFEKWDHNIGVKKLYNIGTKYSHNFKKIKEENIGLLIYGPAGNGKTYTSAAIANSLIEKYVPVICVSSDGLLTRIKETYSKWGKEAEIEVLRSLANADLLVIDDLGAEQVTDWSVSKIYNIIDSRYRNKLPLIITTNKTLKELEDIYEKRTFDRILEMCTPVENNEKSIRILKSQQKTSKLREILG